jgi:hypothetical protein
MAKQARSARGKMVDFDLLAIKQQLAVRPAPVGVNQRRKFIDEKDGIKHRAQENYIVSPPVQPIPALDVAKAAAEESAKATVKPTPNKK